MNVARNLLIAVALVFGSTSSVAFAHPSLPTDNSIADVAERVVESVVNISVETEIQVDPFFADFFGADPVQRNSGKGSGVIVTANGRILTNAHVVNNADDIKVTLHDGTEVKAKVVGKDTRADLAVIQLEGKWPALKPIPWGDSNGLRLGEIVLAISASARACRWASCRPRAAAFASPSSKTSSRPTRRSTRATRVARSSTSRAS
jgi:S1-C subfamily serine protease